jgi:hypothetical protein
MKYIEQLTKICIFDNDDTAVTNEIAETQSSTLLKCKRLRNKIVYINLFFLGI